jgi:bile acid:Na+ symporter, BASS family
MPLAIGIIMVGLGLSLTKDDFIRVVKYPRAIMAGLFCQLIILPLICFGLVVLFEMPPLLAVGMMILAGSPGGPSANLYSYLARADVALNITLTSVNSLLSVITIPIIVNLSILFFLADDATVGMNFRKFVEVFLIVVFPVLIGMYIRKVKEGFATSMQIYVKISSGVFLVLIIIIAVAKEWTLLTGSFKDIGIVALLFNIISLLVGYYVPILLKIPERQALAISMEVGIHNGTLAIYIAMNVLSVIEMALPAAVYSIIMFITAGLFSYWAQLRIKRRKEVA